MKKVVIDQQASPLYKGKGILNGKKNRISAIVEIGAATGIYAFFVTVQVKQFWLTTKNKGHEVSFIRN